MQEGHRGKAFYCRDWAFEKLRACLDKRATSATCGTLIMGDSGCGKTAFCSELVWPSKASPTKTDLSRRLLGYHFSSVVDSQSLSLNHFLLSLSNQLASNDVIGESYRKQLPPSFKSIQSASAIKDPDEYMLTHIIAPLNALNMKHRTVFYLLVDGLDECDDSPAVNDMLSHSIPQLLSRHHKQFPPWLALVCTCSTKAKRTSRMFTGFRKLSLDDITKSHVIQDIQQYILHRLDADDSLRRHLNKETAEILDKLHVKCNGCILYIELILDLVSQHSVSLREVSDIPGTLGGLFMWICQRLFPDVTHYFFLVRPVFNVFLAARHPLTTEQCYNCVITRNSGIRFEDFSDCIDRARQILVSVIDDRMTFSHHSFRLWLQDVKFCSRTYLCDPREGHEMLTLYYTVRARGLSSIDVCEFAYHIQKCNSGGHSTNTGKLSASQSLEEKALTLHEQAVWMLLSQVELQSPTTDDSVTTSMVDSFIMDSSACLSVSATEGDLDISKSTDDNSAHVDALISSHEDSNIDPLRALDEVLQPPTLGGHDQPITDNLYHLLHEAAESERQSKTPGDIKQPPADISQPREPDTYQQTDVEETVHITEQEVDHTYQLIEQPPVSDGSIMQQVPIIDSDAMERVTDSGGADMQQVPASDSAVIQLGPVADSATSQHAHISDDEEFPDELECLDEDLEGEGAGDSYAMDSELDSLSSPIRDQESGPHTELSPQLNPQQPAGKVSVTLAQALALGDLEWLDQALSEGLDVNVANADGDVPLVLASSAGQLQAVEMLILMAGAEVNLPDAKQNTALGVASWHGHDSIVGFLLNNDADVKRPDSYGRSPLLAASYMGHSSIVQQLLTCATDINSKDNDERTALCNACSCGSADQNSANHVEVVKLLIQSGCDVNVVDKSLQTPLHLASYAGSIEICNILLSSDAAVDAVDEGQRTPLMCAVSMGHSKLVDLLIASGADVHHLDQDGRTALGLACLSGHEDIVQVFLDMGQDEMHRDNHGVDCLHFGASEGHAKVVRMLLDYGADVNSQDDQGRTSLFLAARQGKLDALNVLASHGADINLPAHNGKSSLHIACVFGHQSCAQYLIRHRAKVNYKDMEGRTIIYILALENRPECIKPLAEAGANVNAADEQGRTALHVACWQGHIQVVNSLLDLDTDIDCEDNERRTPLQSAAWQGHAHIAKLLCELGADVNHMCDQGATPLCIAAQEGFLDVVSVLCNHGADPNHCDRFGRTAIKIAMKANNDEMLHLIENIMRKYKPSSLTPEAARSRRSAIDESESAVYENYNTNQSDQSARSSVELVAPYAVVSLPRDSQPKNSPKLIQRTSGPAHHKSPSTQRSLNFSSQQNPNQHVQPLEEGVQKLRLTAQHFAGSFTQDHGLEQVKSVTESRQQRRSLELQQLQSAAKYKQMYSVAKVSQLQQAAESHRQSSNQVKSTENLRRYASSNHGQSSENIKHRSSADRQSALEVDDESSDTSEGCDTAPSTISSTRDDKSTPDSCRSESPAYENGDIKSFTQQIVQLGRGVVPRVENVHQILSGEVGYMANPRVNRALYNASQIAAGNVAPPAEHIPNTRSPAKNISQMIGLGKSSRQQSKQMSSKNHKMAAVQNTARTPTYKVQYAAADHPPALASSYAVRNEELMSAEHSLSSVKSRQAKIISSGTRSTADNTSLNSYQDSSRCSPPPVLPPRKGRSSQPPLHSNVHPSKPTLVGVVRPRAQLPEPHGHGASRHSRHPAPQRGGQKETSL